MPIDYKKEYFKEMKKNKFAWGQYFQLRNELFALETHIYDEMSLEYWDNSSDEETPTEPQMSEHLNKFIQDLYHKAKSAVECPICMEKIDSKDLFTTGCGHNYHNDCLKHLKNSTTNKTVDCPMCRKKIYK
mgnify:FL=1